MRNEARDQRQSIDTAANPREDDEMERCALQRQSFTVMRVGATLGFAWVVWPFIGAIFWSAALAILFRPLYLRLLKRFGQRRTPAALATLFVFLAGGALPLGIVGALVLDQAAAFYANVASGQIDFAAYLQRIVAALPGWVVEALAGLGLGDLAAVQAKLVASAGAASRFVATHVFNLSVDSVGLLVSFGVTLYLLFFLLRDGASIAAHVKAAIPLTDADKRLLGRTFATVVRATVKGGAAMAATQGVLGGLVLGLLGIPGPLLWGVVFGLLSMVPAVGAGLLWGPIAVYFLVTGVVWKALLLTVFGGFILTAVDNVLRPLLVGKDTRLPGYLVLVSTLGGVATLGLNGIVAGPLVAALFIASWTLSEERPRVPNSESSGRRIGA